jgi:hydroxymethylbilane synthase
LDKNDDNNDNGIIGDNNNDGIIDDNNDEVVLNVLVASPDGKEVYKEELRGQNPEELGNLAADLLTQKGAKDLIDRVKQELEGE